MGTSVTRKWLSRSLAHVLLTDAITFFYKERPDETKRQLSDFDVRVHGELVDPSDRADSVVKAAEPAEGGRGVRRKKTELKVAAGATDIEMTLKEGIDEPGAASQLSRTALKIKEAAFNVYIVGQTSHPMQTTLTRKWLGKSLKDAIVVPALQHFYSIYPDEKAVDVDNVHVEVDFQPVLLDQPAGSFAKPTGTEPPWIILTLPLVSADTSADLEAIASAAKKAARAKKGVGFSEAAGPEAGSAAGESLNDSFKTDDGCSVDTSNAMSTSDAAAAANEASFGRRRRFSDIVGPRIEGPMRRRHSMTSADALARVGPVFAELAGSSINAGQQLLQVRNASKALSRNITATQIDPTEAALVRKAFSMLDESKKGHLDARV